MTSYIYFKVSTAQKEVIPEDGSGRANFWNDLLFSRNNFEIYILSHYWSFTRSVHVSIARSSYNCSCYLLLHVLLCLLLPSFVCHLCLACSSGRGQPERIQPDLCPHLNLQTELLCLHTPCPMVSSSVDFTPLMSLC